MIVHEITLSFLLGNLACYFRTKVNQSKEWSNGEDDHLPKFCLIWKYGNVKRHPSLHFSGSARDVYGSALSQLSRLSFGSLYALSQFFLKFFSKPSYWSSRHTYYTS